MTTVVCWHLHVQSLSPVVEIWAFLSSITGCQCSVKTACGITYTYMCVCTHWGELYVQAGGATAVLWSIHKVRGRQDMTQCSERWAGLPGTIRYASLILRGKKNQTYITGENFTNVTFLQWFAKVLCEVDPEWVSVISTYQWPCLLTSSALILHWPFNGHVG